MIKFIKKIIHKWFGIEEEKEEKKEKSDLSLHKLEKIKAKYKGDSEE